jgi:hypothetical protein
MDTEKENLEQSFTGITESFTPIIKSFSGSQGWGTGGDNPPQFVTAIFDPAPSAPQASASSQGDTPPPPAPQSNTSQDSK